MSGVATGPIPERFSANFNPIYRMKNSLHWSLKAWAFTSLVALAVNLAPAADMPKVGDPAPAFTGADQNGKEWKLADHTAKKAVLLYFYPKDFTGGCTKQACGLRDQMPDLTKDGVEVVGVSFDSAESHARFIAQHKLNFTLLADTQGKIADAYGARMGDKNMARRVSFLIGTDGKITHVTDAPSADTHLREMKEAVTKLKK
jgi:peroxiredoxin Q/BCP